VFQNFFFKNSANGTNPLFPVGSFFPGNFPLNTRVHTIGNWTTLDWQISYRFGQSAEITPETPRPGYNKEGKRILGEQAIARSWEDYGGVGVIGWQTPPSLLASTTFLIHDRLCLWTMSLRTLITPVAPISSSAISGSR